LNFGLKRPILNPGRTWRLNVPGVRSVDAIGAMPIPLVLRMVFSIPAGVGAHALALWWAPYGVAVMAAVLLAGLLIAVAADAFLVRTPISTDGSLPVSERLRVAGNAKSGQLPASPIRQRLSDEQARLEHLDAERERRGDSGFGKAAEDRIVWGELLELELQDLDEHVRRICSVGQRSRASNTPQRKEGPQQYTGS
jgi:hypothetical protein